MKLQKKYLAANNNKDKSKFYWNSGMFCFKSNVFLEELKTYASNIYETTKNAYNNKVKTSPNQYKIKKEDMLKIPVNSIDYAVIEKSKRVNVVPCEIDWNDLGSFDAIFEEIDKDEEKNAVFLNTNLVENGNIQKPLLYNSKNNLIIGERQIVTKDINDLIIIDTSDVLLISKKCSSQKVKDIVNILKEKKVL